MKNLTDQLRADSLPTWIGSPVTHLHFAACCCRVFLSDSLHSRNVCSMIWFDGDNYWLGHFGSSCAFMPTKRKQHCAFALDLSRQMSTFSFPWTWDACNWNPKDQNIEDSSFRSAIECRFLEKQVPSWSSLDHWKFWKRKQKTEKRPERQVVSDYPIQAV